MLLTTMTSVDTRLAPSSRRRRPNRAHSTSWLQQKGGGGASAARRLTVSIGPGPLPEPRTKPRLPGGAGSPLAEAASSQPPVEAARSRLPGAGGPRAPDATGCASSQPPVEAAWSRLPGASGPRASDATGCASPRKSLDASRSTTRSTSAQTACAAATRAHACRDSMHSRCIAWSHATPSTEPLSRMPRSKATSAAVATSMPTL
mmetsp:Transcript_2585/g.6961  ORF Transcript_2585/g.6961 Transcript_2585/m.6961 type:complete len:204 (-) Transcript_2585:3902-4513(-)